jgi:hypothetical protein
VLETGILSQQQFTWTYTFHTCSRVRIWLRSTSTYMYCVRFCTFVQPVQISESFYSQEIRLYGVPYRPSYTVTHRRSRTAHPAGSPAAALLPLLGTHPRPPSRHSRGRSVLVAATGSRPAWASVHSRYCTETIVIEQQPQDRPPPFPHHSPSSSRATAAASAAAALLVRRLRAPCKETSSAKRKG